jgi:hypoxanthine phosphoribosyltransferase
VCNLKGGFRFLSDLVTFINIPVVIDFIAFTSYEGTAPSGEIRIIKDLKVNVENRDLILIEDIVDTGLTVKRILEYLKSFKSPRSVKICTLLDKQPARKVDVEPDYIGFRVEDRFVVGYGLDFNEYYRELNDIYLYEEGA